MPAQNVAQDAEHDQDTGQQERDQLQILPNMESQLPEVGVRPHVVKIDGLSCSRYEHPKQAKLTSRR